MDPIAHTFFGATLAETGLREKSRYATATLLIGANLPDIDAVTTVAGSDVSLLLRRGWTHGVIAMIVLPLLLAGGVWAFGRWRKRSGVDLRWIIPLAYVSVWSHPLLDFMNTYGVRLLMPFDGRWFYGDALFIVDPWFWLLTASGVVLARSHTRRSVIGWGMLGAAATALVMLADVAPVGVKIGWALGVTALIAMRRRNAPSRPVARVAFVALALYIAVVFGHSAWLEDSARDVPGLRELQTNPLPGQPLVWRRVLVFDDRYEVHPPEGEVLVVPREEPNEVVQAAFEAPSIRGFANWTRFPYWTVEEVDDGWIVTFRDLRYVEPGEESMGIGLARVQLDRDLRPVE